MMKVISILKKKKIYRVNFDNDVTLDLLDVVKGEFHVEKNKTYSEEEFKKLQEENTYQKLFSLTLKRLSKKDCSVKEIKDFIKKNGGNSKITDRIITKLKKYSYLNEKEIVENVLSLSNYKHYGYNKIITILIKKGISQQLVDKVEYNSTREIKEANLLAVSLEKKYKNKNTNSKQRLIYSNLIRNGFSEEIAKLTSKKFYNSTNNGFDESLSLELVNNFSNSNHNNELNVLKLDYRKSFSSYSRKLKGNELKEKLINHLLSKGYRYSDIKLVMEENKNEMD